MKKQKDYAKKGNLIGLILIIFAIIIVLAFIYLIEIEPFIIKNTCETYLCQGTPHTLGYHCTALK